MTIAGSAWDHRLSRFTHLDPVVLRRLVDLTCGVFAVALFLRLADPEILLQGLWLIVAIGAFLYGLVAALWRIAIAAGVMVLFIAIGDAFGVPPTEEQVEFTEWPLMVSIAGIVAVLADRVSNSARHYAKLYRQASERLVTAHEEERASLARELHDGVGQTLTAVILTLDAADTELRPAAKGKRAVTGHAEVLRARELASSALAETRQVAAKLRPTRVHEMGLGAALANLARMAGVPVDVRFEPALLPPGILEPELEIDVYRIVQEAVGNAARHSHARRIWIAARILDDTVRLLVGDDGVGFDQTARDRGLGLDGMQERASIHGLQVEIRSKRGDGTRVEIVVPIRPQSTPPGLQLGPAPTASH
ncbi:MAG TPA: sensor histidine kinase [Candidatus Limnocylindrales bacterium]|nr:sensor histidine kinase [Candidatus Limnocylindrales bacterium]